MQTACPTLSGTPDRCCVWPQTKSCRTRAVRGRRMTPRTEYFRLLVEPYIGVGAGVDEQVQWGFVPIDAAVFDELPMLLGHVVHPSGPTVLAVGQHGVLAAAGEPKVAIVARLAAGQHHLLVVAAERDVPAAVVQVDEPIEDALGVGPAIDVVAEGDDGVIAAESHVGEEHVECAGATVNVADGEEAGHVD